MRYYFVLIILFFISACKTAPTVKEKQGLFFFPDGRYQQEVTVNVTAVKPEQNFEFDGLVQKNPAEWLFVGYNSFGITLFKIREKAGLAIEAESSIEQINKNKQFFLKIFKLVKTIMSLQRNDSRMHQNEVQLAMGEIQAHVKFLAFDESGVPVKMSVESKNQYRVEIKTSSYKVTNKIAMSEIAHR